MKKIQLISNIISAVLLLVYVIFLIISWKDIPDTVATHFNYAGVADAYGSKTSLVIEPIVGGMIFLMIAVLENFPQAWNYPVKVTEKNQAALEKEGLLLMAHIKVIVVAMFCYIGFYIYCPGLPILVIWLGVAAIFAVIIAGVTRMVRVK